MTMPTTPDMAFLPIHLVVVYSSIICLIVVLEVSGSTTAVSIVATSFARLLIPLLLAASSLARDFLEFMPTVVT